MKRKTVLITIMLLFISATAYSANQWKYGMTVSGVQSQPDGGFIMYGPSGADPACAEGHLFYVRSNQNGVTPEGVKSTLALVVTAFITGKTVNFLYDNADSYCFVNTVFVAP